MNSPAVDIAALLEASAVQAGTLGEDMFVSVFPPEPANCIAIYDTGGFEPEPHFDRPTVMIKVRNTDYATGYALAETIKNYLDQAHDLSINSARYIGIWAMSDITFLNYDDNNRAIFSINFRIYRTEEA